MKKTIKCDTCSKKQGFDVFKPEHEFSIDCHLQSGRWSNCKQCINTKYCSDHKKITQAALAKMRELHREDLENKAFENRLKLIRSAKANMIDENGIDWGCLYTN